VTRFGLRFDQLRADDVAHAVRHEDRRRHEGLLRLPRHIRHANGDDQTDDRAEEPDDGVAGHRGASMLVPGAAPDHRAAGEDGQTAEDEKDDADVGDAGREVAG